MSFSNIRNSILFIFFCFFLFSCSAQNENKKIDIFLCKGNNISKENADSEQTEEPNNLEKSISDNLKKITVELAISSSEQQKGFMERKIIPESTGMIFLYKEDRKLHFWMKNTPHPLSIAYIDSSGVIREIYDLKPYSLETVSSIHSLRYALEVPQGMFKRMGIGIGDKISQDSVLLLKRQFYN